MKKVIQILNCILFLFFARVSAQTTFAKVYYIGESTNYNPLNNGSVIAAANNGCLISSKTSTTGILIRIDSIGAVLWTKTLNPPVEIIDFVLGNDTSYYLLGKRLDSTTQYVNLIKLNFQGGLIWSRKMQYDTLQGLHPLSLIATNDSGLVFCGSISLTPQKTFLTKVDKNGNMVWSTVINASDTSTVFRSIEQTTDSGFVLTGTLNQSKPAIIKLTKLGNVSWCKSYVSNNSVNRNGTDILALGNKLYSYFLSNSPLFVTTDLSGNFISAKEYAITNYYTPLLTTKKHRLTKTSDKGFMINNSDAGGMDYFDASFIRIDTLGNSSWVKSVVLARGGDVAQVSDKGYVIIGEGPTLGVKLAFAEPQIGVYKIDSLGGQYNSCVVNSNITTANISLSVTIETVTQTSSGTSQLFSLGLNSIIIQSRIGCIDFIGGVHENSNFNQVSIYPNPSYGMITVKTENNFLFPLKYTVVNIAGQIVMEELSKDSQNTYLMDCSALPPSIYMIQVSANAKILGRTKLVITK